MIATAPRRESAPPDERASSDALLAQHLAAAANGDSAAFEAFYDATAGYARALARRVLHGADVEDLLADVFFEAWRGAARFDASRCSPVTWLLTLVKSRAVDLLRYRAAHPSVAGRDSEPDAEAALDDDPADRLWQQQAGSRLHAALQRLTAAERWVLGLAYFRELTHGEIAHSTGLPLGTVKSHLLRTQTKLRAALAR